MFGSAQNRRVVQVCCWGSPCLRIAGHRQVVRSGTTRSRRGRCPTRRGWTARSPPRRPLRAGHLKPGKAHLFELAARVQHGHHHVDGRDARVWCMAAGIPRPCRAPRRRRLRASAHRPGSYGHRLIDSVVHHFPDQVVQTPFPGGTDVHTGALTNGFEPFEDLDGISAVLVVLLVLAWRPQAEGSPRVCWRERDAARRFITVYREEGTGPILRQRFCTPNRAVRGFFGLARVREALSGGLEGSGGPRNCPERSAGMVGR